MFIPSILKSQTADTFLIVLAFCSIELPVYYFNHFRAK